MKQANILTQRNICSRNGKKNNHRVPLGELGKNKQERQVQPRHTAARGQGQQGSPGGREGFLVFARSGEIRTED